MIWIYSYHLYDIHKSTLIWWYENMCVHCLKQKCAHVYIAMNISLFPHNWYNLKVIISFVVFQDQRIRNKVIYDRLLCLWNVISFDIDKYIKILA